MSKWCDTCYRNEITEEWKSCNSDCPVFGKDFEELARLVIKHEFDKEIDMKDIIKLTDEDKQVINMQLHRLINDLKLKKIQLNKNDNLKIKDMEIESCTHSIIQLELLVGKVTLL